MATTMLLALGGNAILRPGQRGTHLEQMENLLHCCSQIVRLLQQGSRVIITHGNGPQVGNLLIQNEAASNLVPMQPLDSCVAQTQGQIGYMLQLCLDSTLRSYGLDVPVIAVITRVLIEQDDRSFEEPSKPVGPFFREDYACMRMAQGEKWIEDSNRGWRKVVPSPVPRKILDLDMIRRCFESGVVIAAGGGGIPVVQRDGRMYGVEAVVDKDLASSRLARDLGVDSFVILTDVENVKIRFGQRDEEALTRLTAGEAESYLREGHFGLGSMGPKVQAAIEFVRESGNRSIITSIDNILNAVAGNGGTTITA